MNTKYGIAGLLLGIICVYFLSSAIADTKTKELEKYTETNIENQISTLKETATILGRGAVSEDVSEIVPDCSSGDSTKYDTLLSSLDKGLSRSDLIELKSLFDRCGDRASSRRSVMSLKLGYEVASLENKVESLNQITDEEYAEIDLVKWNDLAKKENEIALLFTQLVRAQDEIISTLLGTVSSNVRSVEEIRVEAEVIRTQLTNATAEASRLRSELI